MDQPDDDDDNLFPVADAVAVATLFDSVVVLDIGGVTTTAEEEDDSL